MYYQNNDHDGYSDEYQMTSSPTSRADFSLFGSKFESANNSTPYGSTKGIGRTAYLMSESKMSKRQDIYSSLDYINQELHGMGITAPIRLSTSSEDLEDNQRVVESMLSLINQIKNSADYQQDISSKLRKSMIDEEMLLEKIQKLRGKVDYTERKLAISESKGQKLYVALNGAENNTKKAISDLKISRSAFEANKLQFTHDTKRKEQETLRLKERMQKVIIEKHRSSKVSSELIAPVPKPRSEDETISELTSERRLVDDLIKSYETNENELISENNKLVAAISSLYTHHYIIYKSFIEDKNKGSENMPKLDLLDLEDLENNFNSQWSRTINDSKDILEYIYTNFLNNSSLPSEDQLENTKLFEESKRQAQEKINELNNMISALNYKLEQKDIEIQEMHVNSENLVKSKLNSKQEFNSAQNELISSRNIIAEQEKTIRELHSEFSKLQRSGYKISKALSPIMDGYDNLEDCIDDLVKRNDVLEKEELKLKNEQIQFKSAMLELRNERVEVEKLRQNLKMYQISSQTADFLSTLPPTPMWLKNTDFSLPTPEINKKIQHNMENTPITQMQFLRRNNADTFNQAKSSSEPPISFDDYRKSNSNEREADNFDRIFSGDKAERQEDFKGTQVNRGTYKSYVSSGDSNEDLESHENKHQIPLVKSKEHSIPSHFRKRTESKTEINEQGVKNDPPNLPTTVRKAMKSNLSDSVSKGSIFNSTPSTAKRTNSIPNPNLVSSTANNSSLSSNRRPTWTTSSKLHSGPDMPFFSSKSISSLSQQSAQKKASRSVLVEPSTNKANDITPKSTYKTHKTSSGITPRTVTKPSSMKFCAKPGCAAHYMHYHEDGTIEEITTHELKPPVPKYKTTK